MPAVVVIVMAVCKCPSIPTLMVSTLVAVVLAMLVQGQSLSGILNILDSGFSIDTALPEFNRLVNRGGLQSMLWTAALGILGMLYGSIMEKTGLLEALLSKMDPLVKSTGGLVTAVVLTCTLLMATANRLQYMSNTEKLNVSAQMADRGIMNRDEIREIWNLPPLPDGQGQAYTIRGEYYLLGSDGSVTKKGDDLTSGK